MAMAKGPADRSAPHRLVSSSESSSATPSQDHHGSVAHPEPGGATAARQTRRQAYFDRAFPPAWRRLLSATELVVLIVVLGMATALIVGASAVAMLLLASHMVTT